MLTEAAGRSVQTYDMRWLISLLAALAFLLAACVNGTPSETPSDTAESGETAATATTKAAPKAAPSSEIYDFTGTTLDGEPFDGATLEGRPAVLWFWAPWCPTCAAQRDNVAALHERYADEVSVIGVGGLDNEGAMREFAADVSDVTHLADVDGKVWRHFGVVEQSTYTVLDAEGKVVSEGYLDDSALNDLVAELAEGA